MSEEKRNLFMVLLGLLVVIGVVVSPAVGSSGSSSLFTVSCDAVTQVQHGSNLFKGAEFSDSRLIEIGKELSKPPVAVTNSTNLLQSGVKPLPAIPATFFMVLMGFVCVSLVKDRKLWLTVAFGVLYLGAAGINAVPHLLCNHKNVKVKQSSHKGVVCGFKKIVESHGDAQGTRYIGLLHRMAIPDDDSFAEHHERKSVTAHVSSVLFCRFLRLSPTIGSLYSSLFAIINSSYNSQFSLTCIDITQTWVCPSQVFTSFNHLPHGPPELA